jgi:hypothetical protein
MNNERPDLNTAEWRVGPNGNDVLRDYDYIVSLTMKRYAQQVVREHNAVAFAIRSGENWTLQDWQNWRLYHAMPQEQKVASGKVGEGNGE